MSFSSDVKDELARLEGQSVCCQLSELAAIVSLGGTISLLGGGRMRLYVESEHAAVARTVFLRLKHIFDAQPELLTLRHARLGGRNTYRLTLSGDEAAFVLEGCGILRQSEQGHMGVRRSIPKEITARKCCKRAFLRGAFMASGSIANPEREYHAEFVCGDEGFANAFVRFLHKNGLNAKMVARKGQHVIYLKEADAIMDLLTLMGATRARMELENIRIRKELRNQANRAVNCDSANLKKTVDASDRQAEAIEYIRDHVGLENLPAPLREIAQLRLNYREASLIELGEMLDPPVGKSGVNHRLRRLLTLYQELTGSSAQSPNAGPADS